MQFLNLKKEGGDVDPSSFAADIIELSDSELESINGGILPLVVAGVFILAPALWTFAFVAPPSRSRVSSVVGAQAGAARTDLSGSQVSKNNTARL